MKNLHTIAIIVVLDCIGAVAFGQMPEPKAGGGSSADRPVVAASDPPQVILLTNGRILEGMITRNPEGGYNVRQKLGQIKVAGDEIEGLFASLNAVYEHKKEILPPRDIQERMRLYRWCLSLGLLKQAEEQLKAVLALSPEHEEAMSLLAQLELRIARQKSATSDPAVMQTSATTSKESGPKDLDPAFLNRALRDMALRTNPVIFDLPEPQALKRAQEFNQYIHPIVQKYCASCHNERTPNGFPLVAVMGRAARDPAILRANLDATLTQINPLNLMQSPLLTNSLLPHHPNNQPIFNAPSNPYYRLMANWVSNLQNRGYSGVKPVGRPESASPFGADPLPVDTVPSPASKPAGGFAREGREAEAPAETDPSLPIQLNPKVMQQSRLQEVSPEEAIPAAPGRMIPGSYNGPATEVPKGTRFQKPIAGGGSPEELLKQLQAEEKARDEREKELEKLNDTPKPDNNKSSEKPVLKSKEAGKKPVKIDEKLLEKFILQRSSGG